MHSHAMNPENEPGASHGSLDLIEKRRAIQESAQRMI